MRRDRCPQQSARVRIGDALDGHRHAHHVARLMSRIGQHAFDHRTDRVDQFVPGDGQRRQALAPLRDGPTGIIDDGRRKRIEQKNDGEHGSRPRLQPERDLGPAAPDDVVAGALDLAQHTFGDQVGGDCRDRGMAEACPVDEIRARRLALAANGGDHHCAVSLAQIVVAYAHGHGRFLQGVLMHLSKDIDTPEMLRHYFFRGSKKRASRCREANQGGAARGAGRIS